MTICAYHIIIVTMKASYMKKKCPIADMGFDKRIGSYHITAKIGNYIEFNSFAHSNQRHYHDSYELVIVLDGHGSFEHKGIVKTLHSGDLFIANPPFEEHEIHVVPSESMTVFYLFFKITRDGTLSNSGYEEQLIDAFIEQHDAFVDHNKALLAYISFINDYSIRHKNRQDSWLARMVFEFLFNSMEKLCLIPPNNQTSYGIHAVSDFERILDFIDQNMEKKISAELIANSIGLSRRTIYNMFREHLNCTVNTYIKERKMALAKHYLIMDLPASEVASLVGYDNLPQFSRTFKEYVGQSPRAYVKEMVSTQLGLGRRLSDE